MKTAYVALTLLLLISVLPASAQGGPSLDATVVFDTIYLREGPGVDYPVAGQAVRGDALSVTGRSPDGSWLQAQLSDGSAVWLADYLVTLDGSAASLPVIEVADEASNEVIVPPGCEYFGIGPFYGAVGQSIVLVQGWEAASRELVEEYVDSVLQLVSFDGRIISTYGAYAGDIQFDEQRGTWQIFWRFDMGPVSAGQHRLEWTQMFDQALTDGLDANLDGQSDIYGPEATTYGCTLIVE